MADRVTLQIMAHFGANDKDTSILCIKSLLRGIVDAGTRNVIMTFFFTVNPSNKAEKYISDSLASERV